MSFMHTKYTQAEIITLLDVGTKHESIPLRIVEEDKATQKDLTQAEQKLIDISHKIYLFEGIDAKDVLTVVKGIKFLRFGMDEIIFSQGENGIGTYFIASGRVDIDVTLDGNKSKTVATVDTGHIIGEISTISRNPRNATAISKSSNTTLIMFEINDGEINEKNSFLFLQLYINIASALAKKLEACNERVIKITP